MNQNLKQIYVTKEASEMLDKIDTKIPKYQLASQIILASIKQKK